MSAFDTILNKPALSLDDLVILLRSEDEQMKLLLKNAAGVKEKYIGNKVHLRGLIELSNVCSKNCFYCGIRKGNAGINRYNLSDDKVLEAAMFAFKNHFGSIVIQAGEIGNSSFTRRIEQLLRKIKQISGGKLGITLSLGEQSFETYQRWFEAGAHRYLIRIETSEGKLYRKLHPNDSLHDFDNRLRCINDLKKIGYQTGTGVMIGLPFQTVESLARDLLFMKDLDIDMVGMGPYIEHENTPLIQFREMLLQDYKRFELSLKMIAVLRIMMKDINIAATTAIQTLNRNGREEAIRAGANVIMPNITPGRYRDDYALYRNKPVTGLNHVDDLKMIESGLKRIGGL